MSIFHVLIESRIYRQDSMSVKALEEV